MESENGWILPDGKYVECAFNKHIHCAEVELGMKEEELEKIAVKVSCLPASIRMITGSRHEYHPNFLTERKKMTKKQLATIEQYCIKFRYRPPLDFFFQNGWHDLADLKTTDILSILEKGA